MRVILGLGIVLAAMPAVVSPQRPDTVVRPAAEPVFAGVATLVEEVSIGLADGADEYMLGEVADIALGADGSIHVFDRQVPIIRQYDAAGRFLRNIGRSGRGPGEYLASSGLAVARDGRLLLWDTFNWRINVYAADGTFLEQWTTPSGTSGSSTANYSRALMIDSAGRVVTRKTMFTVRDVTRRPTLWIRYRSDGTVHDTLHPPPWSEPAEHLTARGPNSSVSLEVPFLPRRHVALSPLGYFVAGYPSRYAFEIHRPGQPVVSVRREVSPEAVSRAERAAERSRVEERLRQTDPAWSWNGPDIPATKPLYHGLEIGLDGRIWITLIPEAGPRIGNTSGGGGIGRPGAPTRRAQADTPPRPALYDVFEPDGRYLGQVRVPARVSTVVRRGDHVWAVAFDEDDVPRIKRYRIGWTR
jgi:hypothetical protein